MIPQVSESVVDSHGTRLFVRSVGDGPVVLLCHGFPETSACWVDEMLRLAAAGYRAVAIDMRGSGRSAVPADTEAYSMLTIVGDLIQVGAAFDASSFHVVGDDLGATAAWHLALLRPDVVRSVTGLSVPYIPRANLPADELLRFLDTDDETVYLLRLMEPDTHKDMEADPRAWVEGALAIMGGGLAPADRFSGMVPRVGPLSNLFADDLRPAFMAEALVDELVESFENTGFAGPVSWYRRIVDDWPLLAPWHDTTIEVPALFIGGEHDPVRVFAEGAIVDLARTATGLTRSVVLPDVGHWPHLERPDEVHALLVDFLTATEAAVGTETEAGTVPN